MSPFTRAKQIIQSFKGDAYLFGNGVTDRVGELAGDFGKRGLIVCDEFPGAGDWVARIRKSLESAGKEIIGQVKGARPNAPREDLSRMADEMKEFAPDFYVSFGSGSTIDCAKSSDVLRILGGSIEDYFGMGLVTAALEKTGKKLTPHLAMQTASSSAAHLTKYSNITDLSAGQKKLVVDPAIVPTRAAFDFEVTHTCPAALTADGALDGVSHSLEVFYGAKSGPNYDLMADVARETFDLVFQYLPRVLDNPADAEGREALALATDLGGYAIMVGGTNGAHLTSFSLIDVLSHGRACIMMNPYYTVFYSPAIQEHLKIVGESLARAGVAYDASTSGRDRAVAVAEGLRAIEKRVKIPTTLSEVPGFGQHHIERALTAAKNPQLKMKLQNMPVPLTAELVDEYMGPVLEAGKTGDLSLIKNLASA